jgi:predicted DNA-binding ribbon-helix-helix protein
MASAPSRRQPRPRDPTLSSLTVRNVVVAGHRTSVRLEPLIWDALRDIARQRGVAVNELVTEIDGRRAAPSLTAAIRVYVVDFYRSAAAEPQLAAVTPLLS